MNKSYIKNLLDAFYNGETSVDEERTLMEYFGGENVADELLDEKELFLNMFRAENVETPSSLELKLNNLVDELAEKEAGKETEMATASRSKRKTMWTWIGSAAAGVAILVSAGLFFDRPEANISAPVTAQSQPGQAELSDADRQAIKEAEDALMLLSSNFNMGMNQLAVVSSNIDKTNEILNRTFNHKQNAKS